MYKVITTETKGTVCMKQAICANLCQENMSVATKENFDLITERPASWVIYSHSMTV